MAVHVCGQLAIGLQTIYNASIVIVASIAHVSVCLEYLVHCQVSKELIALVYQELATFQVEASENLYLQINCNADICCPFLDI